MKKAIFRYFGVLSIVLMMTAATATVAWAAWTKYSTPDHLFHNVGGDFFMGVDNYYNNNTGSSVELGWAWLYISFPDKCCIGVERVVVWDGQLGGPDWSDQDNVQVDEGESVAVPLSLGNATYPKTPGGAVTVDNRAGFLGTCQYGDCSTTYVVWEENTSSVWHGYED